MRNCKGIRENTKEREWTKFCLPVRGVNVLVTETSICQIYDAPYYYRDYLYQKIFEGIQKH
ncbi:hypothetical protein Godav_003981 [Gossypium davidsonii]|uniref:Uncharacterized protein n=1 Tax=Gossypium davidsonii TaxID=34287 RepID=A0A7J8SJJ6_GOSDV|nr:hypothetical protein [Gossypium davidsonii]